MSTDNTNERLENRKKLFFRVSRIEDLTLVLNPNYDKPDKKKIQSKVIDFESGVYLKKTKEEYDKTIANRLVVLQEQYEKLLLKVPKSPSSSSSDHPMKEVGVYVKEKLEHARRVIQCLELCGVNTKHDAEEIHTDVVSGKPTLRKRISEVVITEYKTKKKSEKEIQETVNTLINPFIKKLEEKLDNRKKELAIRTGEELIGLLMKPFGFVEQSAKQGVFRNKKRAQDILPWITGGPLVKKTH